MRASQVIIRVVAAGIVVVSVACSGATSPDSSADVATVAVDLVPGPRDPLCNCSYWPDDTAEVVADIRDGRDRPIHDRSVSWQLKWADGTTVGDTIASIAPTGTQTATVLSRQRVSFTVVASVVGNDGVARSGKLFRSWP